jgi:hypothetical protein
VKTAKVVLLGCVLRPGIEWDTVRAQFQIIRNELGSKDWVCSVAQFLRPFIKEMGAGGKIGFSKPNGCVENFKQNMAGAAWRECICGTCGGKPDVAVLNIEGQAIGHNDLTRLTIRARRRWLPYFWDIPPDRFEQFIDLCLECDAMEANGAPGLQKHIDTLLNGCWYWSQGPLKQFLRQYLEGLTPKPDEHIRSVARDLFRTIAEANRATERQAQQFLFPVRAVTFAVNRALEKGS